MTRQSEDYRRNIANTVFPRVRRGDAMYLTDLTEFLKVLTAELDKERVAMPLGNERPWHLFMYRLKKNPSPGRPTFLDSLRFDWDGPFPKSQEVSEVLSSLHWNASATAANPHFDKIALRPAVVDLWSARYQTLDESERAFIDFSRDTAKDFFTQGAG